MKKIFFIIALTLSTGAIAAQNCQDSIRSLQFERDSLLVQLQAAHSGLTELYFTELSCEELLSTHDFCRECGVNFPNPNDGTFSLQILYPTNMNIRVEIWSIFGFKVYEKNLNVMNGSFTLPIDLDVESGSYILGLHTHDNKVRNYKFFIH